MPVSRWSRSLFYLAVSFTSASFGYVLVSNLLGNITSLEPDQPGTNVGRNCNVLWGLSSHMMIEGATLRM